MLAHSEKKGHAYFGDFAPSNQSGNFVLLPTFDGTRVETKTVEVI